MKNVGVVLSGCGVFDGAEIHEAVLTLLYLDNMGANVQCFAPDMDQLHVVNHYTQQVAGGEKRNVLVESARIARGKIKPLSEIDLDGLDAIIFPGGFGAAKNLCSFAVEGANCSANPEAAKVIQEAHAKGKVIGAICISPVLVARSFKDTDIKPRVTIGTDKDVSGAICSFNADAVSAEADEVIVDEKNKIVTTPAYMLGKSISEVARGIEKLVSEVIKLA